MAKILLGCLIGSIPARGVFAVAALLDFIYLAQYTAHNTITLGYLEDALKRFHKYRDYFIQIGVREDFNIPKFHSLLHYIEAIKLFSTTDNYNTEIFERLHIDFAKLGWRASNQWDEFPQMICWLSRQEKIAGFKAYQKEKSSLQARNNSNAMLPIGSHQRTPPISLAKVPNYPGWAFSHIKDKHDAPDFEYYLKQYLNSFTDNPIGQRHLDHASLSFTKVDVYNMFRFHPQGIHDEEEEKDLVKAIPKSEKLPRGRFDTVIALINDKAEATGLEGMIAVSMLINSLIDVAVQAQEWGM